MTNKEWEELWMKMDEGLKEFAEKHKNEPGWEGLRLMTEELIARRVNKALSNPPRRNKDETIKKIM